MPEYIIIRRDNIIDVSIWKCGSGKWQFTVKSSRSGIKPDARRYLTLEDVLKHLLAEVQAGDGSLFVERDL